MEITPPPPPAPRATPALARWLWIPALAFGLTRLGITLVAYLAAALLPENGAPPPYHLRPDNLLLDVFGSRWDTGFYIEIATNGYTYQGVPLPSVAFFPLYPLAIRLVMLLTGDALWAGLLVSNVALLGASILFYRLVAEEWGDGVAERAVWYLLIFPVSFFGSAVYTESLFLFLTIGTLYLARRGYWESAAMLGIGAALSRFVGIIVAPMLLVEWLVQWRSRTERRPPWWGLLAPAAVPLGTLAYMLFLHLRFGDALAFAHASAAWGREPRPIWQSVAALVQPPAEGWLTALATGRFQLDNWLDFLIVLGFLALGLMLLRQRRWTEATYTLLGILIPLNSGLLMSQRRYLWVLFPVFILLARWGHRPWVDRAITTLSLLGLALFTALFATWHWVG